MDDLFIIALIVLAWMHTPNACGALPGEDCPRVIGQQYYP
ncbi:hypothetical protein PARHAE_03241 [Paracoccus haematequi]|uniref:Uncharacterized protein n=1 Tax=Paracoccus haematequi TaxID=2491866 RepID=A0A447IRB1_9RHOB|nr:hypothetical protein PARHAE_03241 [Paracoccus haematequi]